MSTYWQKTRRDNISVQNFYIYILYLFTFKFSLEWLENGSFLKIHTISENKSSKYLEKYNSDNQHFPHMFS